jgi:hypothetical protein
VIYAHCNLHGCNRWDSGYNLFMMDTPTSKDVLNYQPQSSTATWYLSGTPYSFSPTAFSAGTIDAGTLNATTVHATAGTLDGVTIGATTPAAGNFTAIKSGYEGSAQLAAGGSAGYSNFTFNGNNADGSRVGFIGGVTDPNLYLDVPTGGAFTFRVADVNTLVVGPGGAMMGPATAPSGACSTSGAWVFSQDGHATFCNAGTWVTKI